MFKRVAITVAAVAVVLLVVIFGGFDDFIVALYVVGFLAAGLFCFTWFPLAVHARYRRGREVSWVRIVDYAGLQLVIFLTFGLILRNAWVFGILPPRDTLGAIARILLPLLLDALVLIRLGKWVMILRRHRHQKILADPLAAMSEMDRTQH